jgi:hypothetical protein
MIVHAQVVVGSNHEHRDSFSESEEMVRMTDLPATALIKIGTDHRLAEKEPLERMLRECCR